MALENGVLFQTEKHWAMAIRKPDGKIEVSSGAKNVPAVVVAARKIPVLRGLIGLVETARVLPIAYAHGGQVTAFSNSPDVMASMAVSVLGTMAVRGSRKRISPMVEEMAVAALAMVPTLVTMRKTKAIQYHAAEHKSINALEQTGSIDEMQASQAHAEHPRCGSNIIGPALFFTTIGNTLVRRYVKRRAGVARLGVGLISLSGAVELVQWAARNPRSPLARLLTGSGEELQHFVTTAEPTHDQLEVSLAALHELLKVEGSAAAGASADLGV
jgi:uncharacterized protein YqhQ